MRWLNEPKKWTSEAGALLVTADPQTDFWRTTHYGFDHDSGHFYYRDSDGDFVCEIVFEADFADQYDQAGLMLRQDGLSWIKAGVELADERFHLSVVVTRQFSDWSVSTLHRRPERVVIRATRSGDSILIEGAADGEPLRTLRLCYFPVGPLQIGAMCCAPTGPGFESRFLELP